MLEGLQRALFRIQEINSMLGSGQAVNPQTPAKDSIQTTGLQQTGVYGADNTDSASFDQLLALENKRLVPSMRGSAKSGKYSDFIDEAASKYGVDADLIKAVITAESGGNSRAVSKAGAMGLMQLMPSTARGLGVTNAFDPKQNIDGGTKYLKSLIDRFSDIRLAIAGYNAGPGAVSKYGGIPPYSETRKYVEKVTGLYADYKGN